MGPLILAWAIGEGLIVYRAAAKEHQAPVPGAMLSATALFAALALLAEYEPARGAATLFAFGVDVAVLMQVLPGQQSKTTTKRKAPTGGGQPAPKPST